MTAPAYRVPAVPGLPAPDVQHGDEPGCPACPHALATHDPIGARFCRATVSAALDRGCACRAA